MISEYTISETASPVTVAAFRDAIEHLERIVHVERHACVGADEKANWAKIARRIGSELINTTCKRATAADWTRREQAIDASTNQVARAMGWRA